MAYATVDEAITRMGHPNATDANLIARLEDALDAATSAIDNITGRSFTATTATRTFAPVNSCTLHVPDLVSVTTLKTDTGDDGLFATTIAAANYELDTYHRSHIGWPYEIVRVFSGEFPTRNRRRLSVQIAGSWGWSAVPAPINQACALLAARIAQRAATALYGVQSFGDLGAANIRNTDPDVMMLLAPYVRIGIA